MSQRKAREKRQTPSPNGKAPVGTRENPHGASDQVLDVPPPSPPMEHPAVLVMRIPGNQPGQERIETAELNGIDPLSVPVLLRIAANIKESSLGLSERK